MQALRQKKRHWEKKAKPLHHQVKAQPQDEALIVTHVEIARAFGVLKNHLLLLRAARAVLGVGVVWSWRILKGLLWFLFAGPRLVRHEAPGVWQERHEFEKR